MPQVIHGLHVLYPDREWPTFGFTHDRYCPVQTQDVDDCMFCEDLRKARAALLDQLGITEAEAALLTEAL